MCLRWLNMVKPSSKTQNALRKIWSPTALPRPTLHVWSSDGLGCWGDGKSSEGSKSKVQAIPGLPRFLVVFLMCFLYRETTRQCQPCPAYAPMPFPLKLMRLRPSRRCCSPRSHRKLRRKLRSKSSQKNHGRKSWKPSNFGGTLFSDSDWEKIEKPGLGPWFKSASSFLWPFSAMGRLGYAMLPGSFG